MYVQRQIESSLVDYLESKKVHLPVLLIAGARQVGKSTLVQHVLSQYPHVFVNLYERTQLPHLIDQVENFDELERVLLRELNFRPSEGRVLVIDEAQESKHLGRWVRFFKEKWVNQKVILMGSILSNLFEDGIAYPVGRVSEIVVRPFSFKEFLSAWNHDGLIEILQSFHLDQPFSNQDHLALIKPYLSYLQIGGMPEIVLDYKNKKQTIGLNWESLLKQFSIDIERHVGKKISSLFVSAVKRIGDVTCFPLKMSQIISSDSPNYRLLPQLLDILESWYLVHKVKVQTKHPESSSKIPSKRYLFDVGLTNYLVNQSLPIDWSDRGGNQNLIYPKLQENFVLGELKAHRINNDTTISYYRRSRQSAEIDFIITLNGQLTPLEVKSQKSINRNSLKPMFEFLNSHDLEHGVLIYNGPVTTLSYKGKKFFALPPYCVGELPRLLREL